MTASMSNGMEDAGPSNHRETTDKVISRLTRDFPDGRLPVSCIQYTILGITDSLAESLARHGQIHARLQLEIMDIKEEIEILEGELRRDQDPGKMSRIQSQIGVSLPHWYSSRMSRGMYLMI